MTHATAHAPTTADPDQRPPDVATMRAAARQLLGKGAEPPAPADLETLALQLRGHIHLLIPAVEKAARGLPKDDAPRACAMACVGEARMRLRLGDGCNDSVRLSVATKLARSVSALADHYEVLGGSRP